MVEELEEQANIMQENDETFISWMSSVRTAGIGRSNKALLWPFSTQLSSSQGRLECLFGQGHALGFQFRPFVDAK